MLKTSLALHGSHVPIGLAITRFPKTAGILEADRQRRAAKLEPHFRPFALSLALNRHESWHYRIQTLLLRSFLVQVSSLHSGLRRPPSPKGMVDNVFLDLLSYRRHGYLCKTRGFFMGRLVFGIVCKSTIAFQCLGFLHSLRVYLGRFKAMGRVFIISMTSLLNLQPACR